MENSFHIPPKNQKTNKKKTVCVCACMCVYVGVGGVGGGGPVLSFVFSFTI